MLDAIIPALKHTSWEVLVLHPFLLYSLFLLRERERDSYASPSLKARRAVGEREVSHDGFALKSV